MNLFFAEFRIVGEVADFLYHPEPQPRLLVDISIDEPVVGNSEVAPRTRRIATEITNDILAGRFLDHISVGDEIELTGTFTQENYSPHNVAFVDTVFTVTKFKSVTPSLDETLNMNVTEDSHRSTMVH